MIGNDHSGLKSNNALSLNIPQVMSDRGSITSYTHHAAQNRLYHNFILYLLRVDRILQSTATTNYEYISPKLFPLTLRLCLCGPCCGAAAWAESEAPLPGPRVQQTRCRVLERLTQP